VCLLAGFLVCSAILAPASAANPDGILIPEDQEWSLTSIDGIRFEISLNSDGNTIVSAENPTGQEISVSFVANVDKHTLIKKQPKMKPGERKSWSFDASNGINVVQEEHTIRFATYGNSTSYNFTKDIDSASADGYPKPYIGEVNVTRGTIDGEPSSVANVTIVNPGPQTYGMLLLVNTEGTDGSFYAVSIPTYSNETFTVELLEPVGDKVAGEARLYTDKPRKREGALDQVEFVGAPDTETKQWNTSYEPVRGPWLNDPYEYENESIHTDTDDRENLNPFDDPERRKYTNAAILTVGGVLAVAVYRKLTRTT